MAAATFNVHTLRIQGQTYVDKFVADLGAAAGKWLTADQYDSMLLPNIISDEATYTLQRRTTGIYTLQPKQNLYLSNQVTPFTGDDDVTYSVFANGMTVKSVTTASATAGTFIQVDHSASTIDVVGAAVDFNSYMADLFGTLKSQRATEITESIGDASFTIDNTRARIDAAIAYWNPVNVSAN